MFQKTQILHSKVCQLDRIVCGETNWNRTGHDSMEHDL